MGKARGPDRSDADEPIGQDVSLTFEQAMERIEAIIDRIESGRAGLEESIREYEAGAGLLRRCREILAAAEQRVTMIDRARLEDNQAGGGIEPGHSGD